MKQQDKQQIEKLISSNVSLNDLLELVRSGQISFLVFSQVLKKLGVKQ